jgi:hypothetical protein
MNEQAETQEVKFSPLMLAVLRAAQFLVFLKESEPDSVPNEVIKAEFQKMIDTGALAIFASSISFSTLLMEHGELIGSRTPAVQKPQIIVPPGRGRKH